MGVLERTIARTIDSRHVGILSRVKAGWRWASNRVRAGATAAAVIERQLNGFTGSWTGAGSGSASRLPKRTATKQINNEIVCQLYLDIPTQAATPAMQCKRHIPYVEARIWPFNGQTARNQTKLRTPLHSPFGFGARRRSGITNGPSSS
jgi:hypothetical protein